MVVFCVAMARRDDITLAAALQGSSNEYKVKYDSQSIGLAIILYLPLPVCQIIVIGALGVGKTSLLMRYVHNQFQDRISTFIAEKEKVVTVKGQEVPLKIWDTAGKCQRGKPLALNVMLTSDSRSGTVPEYHKQVLC